MIYNKEPLNHVERIISRFELFALDDWGEVATRDAILHILQLIWNDFTKLQNVQKSYILIFYLYLYIFNNIIL